MNVKNVLILLLLTYCFQQVSGQSEFSVPSVGEYAKTEFLYFEKETVKELKLGINSSEYKKDLKRLYNAKKDMVYNMAMNDHIFFSTDWENYLTNIAYTITSNNAQFAMLNRTQVVLSSYFWPNAFSVGEGTIVINPGLISVLENEDQLAFVICHEFAHFLLKHSEKMFVEVLQKQESEEIEARLKNINNSEYYKLTKFKDLLKTFLYETNNHIRANEKQADSLGLVLYLNTHYKPEEALNTIQILENLNKKKKYDIDVFEKLGADSMGIDQNTILSESKKEGSWIDLDSLKTHPDCEERFNILARRLKSDRKFDNQIPSTTADDNFSHFKKEMKYFKIHCYLQFDRLDLALLECWNMMKHGDSNLYLQKMENYIIASFAYARTKHRIGTVCSYPNDSMSLAQKQLSNMLYGMRFKALIENLNAYAESKYYEKFDDEISIYSAALLAYCLKDEGQLKIWRDKYLENFYNQVPERYNTIKYLIL
ncbi:MAG: M48 family metalloprotease [Flavobacteriales bacterium]|nr:M48 family metalloprotease [Flavobacteriales bacterium]